MKPALVLDVNETLLDLAGLDPYFERVLGDPGARRDWFAALLHTAMVTTITRRYEPFGSIGAACLRALGRRRDRPIGQAEEQGLAAAMTHLDPHPDVHDALSRLRGAGFQIAALTNSTLPVAREQLDNAGLAHLFDHVLSADEVRRLKPAPEPYQHAARRLGVGIADVLLVAAHGWDVAGAQAAGARAAFVARPGQEPLPTGPEPDLSITDLTELASALAGT
jgi:2-haloacid dehalogenase